MAITFVGSATGTGASASFNISLSGLGLQQGDLVIVATGYVTVGGANGNPGVSTSGYTEVADLFSDDGREAQFSVNYKLMGATPDTTVACNGSGSASLGAAGIAYALRGVDQTTPLDVTSTTATGIDSAVPDPPSITPTTSGSYVVITGCGTAANLDETVTHPTGYSNGVIVGSDPSTAVHVACASKAWTSGAEDPGAWTDWTTSTTDAWAAATMAIRPAADAGGQPIGIRGSHTPHQAQGRVGSLRGGRW